MIRASVCAVRVQVFGVDPRFEIVVCVSPLRTLNVPTRGSLDNVLHSP